jgi:hypothetical protein
VTDSALIPDSLRQRYSAVRPEPASRPPTPVNQAHHGGTHQLIERWSASEPKTERDSTPTKAQQRWLKAHPEYEIVVDGCRYNERGILTTSGHYFVGGYAKTQPSGYLRVGIRKLTRKERACIAARERRAALAADPAAYAVEREKRRQRWRKVGHRYAAQRRAKYERDRQDPVWLEKERRRTRVRMRIRRAAAKAAKEAKLRGGEISAQ